MPQTIKKINNWLLAAQTPAQLFQSTITAQVDILFQALVKQCAFLEEYLYYNPTENDTLLLKSNWEEYRNHVIPNLHAQFLALEKSDRENSTEEWSCLLLVVNMGLTIFPGSQNTTPLAAEFEKISANPDRFVLEYTNRLEQDIRLQLANRIQQLNDRAEELIDKIRPIRGCGEVSAKDVVVAIKKKRKGENMDRLVKKYREDLMVSAGCSILTQFL